jgi:hypothetical protein
VVTPSTVASGVDSTLSNAASQYSVSLPVVSRFPPESYVFCWQTLQFFSHDENDNAIKMNPAVKSNILFIHIYFKTKDIKTPFLQKQN